MSDEGSTVKASTVPSSTSVPKVKGGLIMFRRESTYYGGGGVLYTGMVVYPEMEALLQFPKPNLPVAS